MFFQPGVRIQRHKGYYRMKLVIHVAFIIAFWIWVLSHDKKQNYGGIPENLYTLKHTVDVLGRKGYVATRKFEEMNSAVPVTASKGSEKDNIDNQRIDEVEATISYKEEDAKKIADNTILQSNEMDGSLNDKQGELGHGITGYHDENGIPQDDHEIVKFSPNETIWDDNTANDQAILRSHSHSWKKNDTVVEEVKTISEEHNVSGTSSDSGNVSDKSGANTMPEISEKNCVAVKVSSYTSRQDNKGIAELKKLPQTGNETKSEN